MGQVVLDTFEYANDGAAQAAYVTSDAASAEGIEQTWDGGYDNNLSPMGAVSASEECSQGFQIQSYALITKVEIYMHKYNEPTDNLTLRVEGNDGGYPDGNLVHANATKTLDASTFPAFESPDWINWAFPGTFALIPDTTYQYRWTRSGEYDGLNRSLLTVDDPGGYALGHAGQTDEGVWTQAGTQDVNFKLYGTHTILQCYSESVIVGVGTYALKIIANKTDGLNQTLTKSGLSINLTGAQSIKFKARALRTGTNFSIALHDSGGATTTINVAITDANTWEDIVADVSGVADADKDDIDSIIIKVINADALNIIYLDQMYAEVGVNFPITRLRKDVIHGYNCFMHQYVTASREGLTPLKLPDGTVF